MSDDPVALNRLHWNELVPIHAASDLYDLQHYRGERTREWLDRGELGDVGGRSLLHLQCHIGTDTLAWVRHGADVTGADFSEEAIRVARELSVRLHLPATFVCAEISDLPQLLQRRYDLVYTSYGVLTWLPDLTPWAESISKLLEPGGRFYVADTHPFVGMFEESFGSFENSYFHSAQPRVYVEDGSYADRAAVLENKTSCEWQHALSDVVNALTDASLRIERVHEFPYLMFPRFPQMQRGADGWWRLPDDDRFPLLFSILATK